NQIESIKETFDENRYYELKINGTIDLGDGFEIDNIKKIKHDTYYREYDDGENMIINQLNIFLEMCNIVERDNDIDQKIIYNENHENYFKDIVRVLSNPTKEESEIIKYKKKEISHDINEKKEYYHFIFKNEIDELSNYIFKRLILFYNYYNRLDTPIIFKHWFINNNIDILESEICIELCFNIKYNNLLSDYITLEDISLLIMMTRIGFDYSLFKEK
ncbi:8579_t:CDS:1, partial [Cetraspora pellucida]